MVQPVVTPLVLIGVQHDDDADAPDPVAAAQEDLEWAQGAAADPVVPAAPAPQPLRHVGVWIGHPARHIGFAGRGGSRRARCVRGVGGF
jgi:hypothetical protein